jgi:ATP-dependent Clp protease ATP-binding subunit ClpB
MEPFGDDYVSTEHLFLSILDNAGGDAQKILKEAGITKESLFMVLKEIRGSQRVTNQNPEGTYAALEQYGKNLVTLARRGKLDPVIGRDERNQAGYQIPIPPDKNNPVLIANPR